MTTQEKYRWAELALWLVVLFFVWMRLTDGIEILGQSIGTTVIEQPPAKLLWTYGFAGVLIALGQLIIRQTLYREKDGEIEADERDIFIERKSDQVAYWTGFAAANVLIVHVLLTDAFVRSDSMPLDFTSPAGILLGLLSILIIQEIAKAVTTLTLYKTS